MPDGSDKKSYRLAEKGEFTCAKCKYMNIREVSGRPECTYGPGPYYYAIGLKRTCEYVDPK